MAFSIGSDFSTSFTQDSGEVKEMFCEVCDKHDKKYVPAKGFCVECFEYLCGTCLKYHKIYMKSHTIKDKDNMPKDFCIAKCSVHQDELIKFYCQDCKKVACTECKSQDHGKCSIVCHLPALVPGIENSQEFKKLTKNLDELMKDLENTAEQVNINMKYVASQETKILDTVMKKKKEILSVFEQHHTDIIQNFEKKIEETLQKLEEEKKKKIKKLQENQRKLEKVLNDMEKEIKRKIEIIKKNDKKVLQKVIEETSKMKTKLNSISTELVHHQGTTDQRCQLFVVMKKGQEIIDQLKPDAEKQSNNNSIHYYKVECKDSEQNITNLQDCHKFFTYKEKHESEVQRTASYYTDIKFRCDIPSSLCLLSENCLLVTNYTSCKLILFKDLSVSMSSSDTIDLPSNPWVVAKVGNNKVAVTFPRSEIISLITFSKCMTVTNIEDIKVGECCHGVAYSNKKLIVPFTDSPARVKILDMSGKVLKILIKDQHGTCLFADPHYLTVSADNTVIFVSDFRKNCVTGLTFDGNVKAIYEDDQLNKPYQLTVDRSGAVFVCGFGTNNTHQLSPDLTKVKILLDIEQGIYGPVGVAYCKNTKRILTM
ncbi:uncharacterized protein LOC132739649 [Ruditapes philippinarum]|uniref:uncharacterized protein LOC132739649 n=1 Tax=Ruditapes philippinarum TaxID=129788 RepID=UPI00295A83F8|nr:uncharacterized protein LOC132739649 [Ruditapes philippinarum]